MNTTHHPLIAHLKETGESLTDFAGRVGMSRMHLYRIVRGSNTTLERLTKISNATGGKVTLNDFAPSEVAQ